VTESEKRALKIIARNPGITPARFAELMWPNSEGHQRHHRCGYGTSRGSGMALAAGGYLGKLVRRGLVKRHYDQYYRGHYTIVRKGK
jgi:hypothetical protein